MHDIKKFTLKYILSNYAILPDLFWPYEQIFCCSLNMLYACNYEINKQKLSAVFVTCTFVHDANSVSIRTPSTNDTIYIFK